VWRLLTSIAVSTTSTAVGRGRGPIGSTTAIPWGTPPKASTATKATTTTSTSATTTTNCNNA